MDDQLVDSMAVTVLEEGYHYQLASACDNGGPEFVWLTRRSACAAGAPRVWWADGWTASIATPRALMYAPRSACVRPARTH